MDIEQLKLIVGALNGLGESSKEVAILYFALSYLQNFFTTSVIALVVVYLIRKAFRAGDQASASEKLMRACGVQLFWSDSELLKAEKVLGTYYRRYTDEDKK